MFTVSRERRADFCLAENPPRVLIVAPANGSAPLYDQMETIAGITRDLPGAVPLAGDVRERDILEAIDKRGPFDGLIISGHAGSLGDRITLEDGELSAGAIAAYASKAAAQWIILAAPFSDTMTTILLLATAADLVTTTDGIGDREAWRIARLITQAMAAGADFRTAIRQIGPAALGPMRYHANPRRDGEAAPAKDRGSAPMSDYRDGGRLEEAIDALRREITGLASKVALMEYQINQLHDGADRYNRGNSQLTWTIVAGSIVIALSMIAMMVIDFVRP